MQTLSDKEINKHHIYLTDNNVPIVIPCIYARWTVRNGVTIEEKHRKDRITDVTNCFFEESEISEDAQVKRLTYLGHFLDWIDSDKSPEKINLSNHTTLPDDYINKYINDYIINTLRKSEIATNREVVALKSYYNFLHYFFDNQYKKIGIFSENRPVVRDNNQMPLLVKYILSDTRELLYDNAPNIMQELLLKNGGELGCRSMENRGFLLNDYKSNKEIHKGLLSLFEELESQPDKQTFNYHLSSLYTKYGRSRTLYIERDHLIKMKTYYENERPDSDSNHLFINNDGANKGQCISKRYATDKYREIKDKVRELMRNNPSYYSNYQPLPERSSYHHLRHSFGTDIFYEECEKLSKNYESITTESAVYLETARRLGHKVDSRNAPKVTKTYIHSCGHREQLQREIVYG
ncbi:TPA: site-specific integrase [Vibrio parahaemolyticus]|nr:site-specific integrase [Vibrio parahaemolyticus]EGR3369257.1 site-specific integrase [Vibrio parahaemolyticus]EHH2553094.1 site-specific integrase [Vibrio parahaemolyticus]EIE1186437.1 site-specific integrase [Vibrio parahaemolyticus]EJC6998470.1 site-specific integrase [Vibrio parahaemolyticus]